MNLKNDTKRSFTRKSGFTLLELVVAMSVWMIFMAGVTYFVWHTSRSSSVIMVRQNAFENARVAVDMLAVNLQMADDIVLRTDPDGMLRYLSVNQICPQGSEHFYNFRYNRDLSAAATRFQRLEMGGGTGIRRAYNEIARYLSEVRLVVSADRQLIHITVTASAGLEEPITLGSAVDIRYKEFELVK